MQRWEAVCHGATFQIIWKNQLKNFVRPKHKKTHRGTFSSLIHCKNPHTTVWGAAYSSVVKELKHNAKKTKSWKIHETEMFLWTNITNTVMILLKNALIVTVHNTETCSKIYWRRRHIIIPFWMQWTLLTIRIKVFTCALNEVIGSSFPVYMLHSKHSERIQLLTESQTSVTGLLLSCFIRINCWTFWPVWLHDRLFIVSFVVVIFFVPLFLYVYFITGAKRSENIVPPIPFVITFLTQRSSLFRWRCLYEYLWLLLT